MKSLIVCVSKSHGNTRRVAERMAEVLDAEVVDAESVDPEKLCEYDLVGFGSGIYYMTFDSRIPALIRRLPQVNGIHAFTFFTSGAREIPLVDYTKPVRNRLESQRVCRYSTRSPAAASTRSGRSRFIGGINRGRPDDHDLGRAAAFAERIRKRVVRSQAAS